MHKPVLILFVLSSISVCHLPLSHGWGNGDIEGRMGQGKAIVTTISAFYITNNAPCQNGGTLSHFLGMVHCYWQGMPVM